MVVQENETPVISHKINKSGKRTPIYNEKLKKEIRQYEDSVLKLMKLKRTDIELTRIYNDQNKNYLTELQEKSQKTGGKKQGCFVIPKGMYEENKEFYETEVINKNHKLILIDTKSNPIKIIK